MKSSIQRCLAVLALAVSTAIGCSTSNEAGSGAEPGSTSTAIDGSQFVLSEEPADASNVIAARENVKDGEEVVLVGRIGGSGNPWIEGRAAFSVVDESLQACSDIPGDECPAPWDYCCETDKLPSATTLVKFVDEKGDLIKADAKQLLNVKELSTVVVKGTAKRDDAGNLTVLADGVYVKQK